MSCLLSSMPLSTYARNMYLYTYHRFAYVNHRVHSSLLQSIKTLWKKNCYGKKVNSLKLFKFFLIVCKIIVVAIVACSIALDVECMPEDQVQTQQKQIINLSYTNKLTYCPTIAAGL